jgi:hypothetical protein
MIRTRREWSAKGFLPAVICALVTVGTFELPARADDENYVSASGRRWRMIKSDSEVAVFFKPETDITAASRGMASRGIGVVQSPTTSMRKPVRLMKVADTSVQRRSRVRQDPSVDAIRPVYRFEGIDAPMISTGTVLVKLRESVTDRQRDALFEEYGLEPERVVPAEGLEDVYRVGPIDDDASDITLGEQLAADERTLWAQPNLIRPLKTRQLGVDDPFYDDQWHLSTIEAPAAWAIGEGQDILVGMFDDACDTAHEDLRNNYIGLGHDPTFPSNDPGYEDPRPKTIGDRHGTAVMGIAVAEANEVGVRGVAYLSQFTCSRGVYEGLSDFEIAGAYRFARQKEVDVHMNSWGVVGPNSSAIEEALETAFLEGRELTEDNPLGMVIVFASGNENLNYDENPNEEDYANLPWVIGVGASNQAERRASYSNYGSQIDVLAPSGDDLMEAIATTDNEDETGYPEDGYNRGGFLYDDILGLTATAELDNDGFYTRSFSGTSAACPIVGGVAALILSVNKYLTATDVRLILEHTADQINADEAAYDGISSRSLTHGYGRVNALRAVEAAEDSLSNGGLTWPEMVTGVRLTATSLVWDQKGGTDEFLVVESDAPFDFVPEDGTCYSRDQVGCSLVAPTDLPGGLELAFDDCSTGVEPCEDGWTHTLGLAESVGDRYVAIYARSRIGRYSFGVAADSAGGDPDDDPDEVVIPDTISVTLQASPKSGESPLEVSFVGNASSTLAIDRTKTDRGCGEGDAELIEIDDRNWRCVYTVPDGDRRTFTAWLTMEDIEGNSDTAEIDIEVDGGGDSGGPVGDNDIRILVGVPGTSGSDEDTGTAPFEVELTIDAASLVGTFLSARWDLGDGTEPAPTSLVVPHTYQNDTDADITYPVTVTVTTLTSAGTTVLTTASRLITVKPNPGDQGPVDGSLDGTGAEGPGGPGAGCGAFGLLIPPLTCLSLMFMRRRRGW